MVPDVGNDEQLGIYCIRNNIFVSLEKVPPDILKYLDCEKVGYMQREIDEGVYAGGHYINTSDIPHVKVYNGGQISEVMKDTGYYIKLRLISEAEPEGTWLKLPAEKDALQAALIKLKISGIHECSIDKCVSIFRNLKKASINIPTPMTLLKRQIF